MSIHVALHHLTHYTYDRLVQLGPQVVRLRPAPHSRSRVLAYSLKVEPSEHFINWQQDPYANYQARLVFPNKTRQFKVMVDLVVEMSVYNPFDFFLEPYAEQFPLSYAAELKQELAPYLVLAPELENAPLFQAYLASISRQQQPTIDFLVHLNQKLQADIRYLIRLEPGVQTPEESLHLASGSCRDSAWLLVQLLRHLGLAARFVSGYLIQLAPDVKSLDGPSGTEVDFTDLHAWCEVYLPGAGWIGLDPTSGLLAGEGHLPLACTPQPSSAAPIEGLVDDAEVEFSHQMQITRILESPRVTKPYSDEQWSRVVDLGHRVDEHLKAADVRLTMGGEPTFVSIDNRDAAEWNTEALGPTKRKYATDLIHRLYSHYGKGGFLHFGQGKWYPGEQLPRWALSIYWRTDGQTIWQDPALFADERKPLGYTTETARLFIHQLTSKLGLGTDFIKPGYEDTFYELWRQRRLPVNVDPFDVRLDDGHVVGYALPLSAGSENLLQSPWHTGPWFFRDERMYLMPGDSPMGYRLPLDSLPWVSDTDSPWQPDVDPFAPVSALPNASTSGRQHYRMQAPAVQQPVQAPALLESAKHLIRTALVTEVRDQLLYVFMPPLSRLEHYIELLVVVEATAADMGVKVVIEGYPPPKDSRLKMLQVTPDPGVIEVNIHPAENWNEVIEHTEFLYQAAFECRLSAEKFMTDGRHTGTGGGNHMVLGGATPDDSPFFRKPELLASLILYWHNHPCLSYLFSGQFIGPTSQAPRVDEARNDQVYELELALNEVMNNRRLYQQKMPPWLIDRVLRNVLIDVTGNTHRSEFCIDKLYSPDSATGRLGLLELRAFEMPPHARMSLVQQLLLRALVSRFWQQPYQAPVARWGTELHDRFMLPHWIKQDFDDVLTELGDVGYAFDPAWFAPHFEFRFPKLGEVNLEGVNLVLRNALEPWHVMGEENSAGGTARYVDSSLERLEVLATGLNPSRYAITVNGQPLALQSTGTAGQWVGGVRYKAWNPAFSLHPTIGIHAPLTFDLVDTWMNRSLGGCQYHVAHPGGRNYDTLPVNAYEAESRRLARFFNFGHSPGRRSASKPVINTPASREFPFTLDLRR
jgi:uncharacterized protein (DUF2126 family)